MGSLALLLAVLPSLLLTPPGAHADPGCSLVLGGELHTSLVLTADQDILVAGRGCELTLLAGAAAAVCTAGRAPATWSTAAWGWRPAP